jgi:hypothetical protein
VSDLRSEISEPISHAQYCPIKNSKSALFFVAYFALLSFTSWRGLHRGPASPDLTVLLFILIVAAIFVRALVEFKCFRERLIFGIAIAILSIGQIERYAPSAFGGHFETEKLTRLVLALAGLLISLTMLIQSLVTRPAGRTGPLIGNV